jgi:hypothetical protein
MEVILIHGEDGKVGDDFLKSSQRERVIRYPFKTGICRTFCFEAVLQTNSRALRPGWPPGHCYIFFGFRSYFLKYSCHYPHKLCFIGITDRQRSAQSSYILGRTRVSELYCISCLFIVVIVYWGDRANESGVSKKAILFELVVSK